jgi:hypothetical protein
MPDMYLCEEMRVDADEAKFQALKNALESD